jgi:hypothetical protein
MARRASQVAGNRFSSAYRSSSEVLPQARCFTRRSLTEGLRCAGQPGSGHSGYNVVAAGRQGDSVGIFAPVAHAIQPPVAPGACKRDGVPGQDARQSNANRTAALPDFIGDQRLE